MIKDYIVIALRSLRKRKIRSFLTILGIILAVLTIFVLLSLSLGLNEVVHEQFEQLGGDKFFIQPKGKIGLGTSSAVELTTDDVDFVEKIKGIEMVTYFTIGNGKIEFNDKTRYYFVIGLPTSEEQKEIELVFEALNLDMDEGRLLKSSDRKKIMIGYNYRYRNLFDKPIKTGDTIEINDVEFEVIGVVEEVGNPQDDQQVYIGLDDFKELFDSEDRVDYMFAQINPGEDMKEVSERVERRLMEHRDVDEKTVDFDVLTPEQLLGVFGNVLNILTAFLVGIGAISLIIGGIGIANTMYTSVLERRKEIGTMKAIGARNSDILVIFVIEAGILGLSGGILGLTSGIAVAKTIEYFAAVYIGSNLLRASMNPLLIAGSLIFAFLIGIISGFFPANQASKLKPVDALRYE
jgi:putative ABC transport system permease protein